MQRLTAQQVFEVGQKFLDAWSFAHGAGGFLAAKSGILTPFSFLLAHTLFELWENSEQGVQWFQNQGYPRYEGDTLTNSLGDTFFAMWGYWEGEKA